MKATILEIFLIEKGAVWPSSSQWASGGGLLPYIPLCLPSWWDAAMKFVTLQSLVNPESVTMRTKAHGVMVAEGKVKTSGIMALWWHTGESVVDGCQLSCFEKISLLVCFWVFSCMYVSALCTDSGGGQKGSDLPGDNTVSLASPVFSFPVCCQCSAGFPNKMKRCPILASFTDSGCRPTINKGGKLLCGAVEWGDPSS